MPLRPFQLLARFRDCDAGVTLVEYAVALTVVVTLGAAAFIPLTNAIEGSLSAAGSVMVTPP